MLSLDRGKTLPSKPESDHGSTEYEPPILELKSMPALIIKPRLNVPLRKILGTNGLTVVSPECTESSYISN